MKQIRVLLADDHHLFRAGLRALMQGMEGIEVVAEASNGHEALALVAEHSPQVLLRDITMPGMSGLEVTRCMREKFPEVRVLILSMHASEQYAGEAMQVGAAGYLLKEAVPAELENALRTVARGENYLSPAVSGQVVAAFLQATDSANSPLDQLTPRQREVLQLIAEGKTTKQIASILGISVRTAETHRLQLMNRLGIHDIVGLVRFAARAGMVDLE